MVLDRKMPAGLAKTLLSGCLILCCVCACQPVHPSESHPSATFTSSGEVTEIANTQTDTELNVLLVQWLENRQTPVLMIHNNAISPKDLTLLDAATGDTFQVNLPQNTRITNLNNSVSPNQEHLALIEQVPGNSTQKRLIIYDLLKDAILWQSDIAIPERFVPAQVFSELPADEQSELKTRNLGAWVLQESLGLSLGTFRWSRDSQSLYFANYCNDGFACLLRYDLGSDRPIQLEAGSGYFDSIRQSPDGSKLLIVKSVVPQLPDFPLTQPAILDKDGNASLLPKGESILNTHIEYEWSSNNEVIRTYFDFTQMRYLSLERINLSSNQVETLASQPFDDYLLKEGMLYLLALNAPGTQTNVKVSEKEKPDTLLTIEDKCSKLSPSSLPNYSAYVACENGLYGISPEIEAILLLPMDGNFSFSPDSQRIVTYAFVGMEDNQPNLSFFDNNFSLLCRIPGQDVRQVIWFPNSQGLLYLNPQGLYRVNPMDCIPHLVLHNTSDDYRHLDALWYSP